LGVELKWTYLIQFPSKELPDKHEIFFGAFTNYTAIIKRPREEKKLLSTFRAAEEVERLWYSIAFTDITWGEDISSYMNNYIVSKTERLSSWHQNISAVGLAVWLPLALILGMVTTVWSLLGNIDSQFAEGLKQYGDLSSYVKGLKTLDDKLDFLIKLDIIREKIGFPLFTFLKPLAYIVSMFFILYLFLIRKKSFIIVNEYSSRCYRSYDKSYDYIVGGLLVGAVVSILAGLFSNSIYDYFKSGL
jgi:hypothetical protein